jgi:hypothetical protein
MRETIEEYTWCSAYFEYRRSKNQTALREIPLSAEIRITPEQLSLEHPPLKSSRTPQEEPHFVALSAGATSPPKVSYHHDGGNFFAGNPPPRGYPGLKCTWTDVIFKKFHQKMNFKFLKNVQHCTNFRSIQLHHLQPSSIS